MVKDSPGRRSTIARVLLAVSLATALVFGAVPGVLASAPTSVGPGTRSGTTASAAPFRLDLSTKGDFVAQTNFVQCVGASMQMMLNMLAPVDDRTAATQLRFQTVARALSPAPPDGRTRPGASVIGWTAGLTQLGAGPYRMVGDADLQAVLRMAARAMRETGRPVGLLVWAGRHAWVLAGFTSTADPLTTSDFRVTGAVILDPLYPYGSKTWGPSPKPRQTLSMTELARQFVPRRSGKTTNGQLSGFNGRYMIVMPWMPTTHIDRRGILQ